MKDSLARRKEVIARVNQSNSISVVNTKIENSVCLIQGVDAFIWTLIDSKRTMDDIFNEVQLSYPYTDKESVMAIIENFRAKELIL